MALTWPGMQFEIRERLPEWDDSAIERQLSETYDPKLKRNNGEQAISLLDRLKNPTQGHTQADELTEILEEVGDYMEDASIIMASLLRYAATHEIWKTHIDPSLRTEQSFLAFLVNRDTVSRSIVIAKSTESARRGSINNIEKKWGADWWSKIPHGCRLPYESPFQAPKRLLAEIANTCKAGISLQDAVTGWSEARSLRRDPDYRRATKSPRLRLSISL